MGVNLAPASRDELELCCSWCSIEPTAWAVPLTLYVHMLACRLHLLDYETLACYRTVLCPYWLYALLVV